MNVSCITVSRLAICQRCPRLLAYDLHKGATNAWMVGIRGKGAHYGSLFHNSIARPFLEAASGSDEPIKRAIAEALDEGRKGARPLEQALLGAIEKYIFFPFLDAHAAEYSAEKLSALAFGTENWVQVMAEFLAGISSLCKDPIANMPKVFFKPETQITAYYESQKLPRRLKVTGQFDALLLNPDEGEAVIFEFKGYGRSDMTVPLSQALTYAWLVKQDTGITPGVQVIYLDEAQSNRIDKFSSAEVDTALGTLPNLFETALDVIEYTINSNSQPLPKNTELCAICPFAENCDADWSPTININKNDSRACNSEYTRDTQTEAQNLMARLLSTLDGLGLSVESIGYDVGPAFVRLKVKPVLGRTNVNKILKLGTDLQVQMGLSIPPRIEVIGGSVAVDVPRAQRQAITLEDLLAKRAVNALNDRDNCDVAFPLGMTVNGQVRWVHLAEPNSSHILIGGMTGSGKSVLLKSIVAGLLLASPPGSVSFTLVDPKMVTFSGFEKLRALDGGQVIYDLDGALDALTRGVAEMERRYQDMKEHGLESLDDMNAELKLKGMHLKRQVFIIDEYADLMMDKNTTAELQSLIQRIAQKGRAAGLHLILATQRPDAKVVTGLIKSNLPLHIALKVVNKMNSTIIIDESGAEKLLGHGDMLAPLEHGGLERLQGAFIADVKKILGPEYFAL